MTRTWSMAVALVATMTTTLAFADTATPEKAQHRLPPVMYSLGIPAEIESGLTHIFTWSVMGYHDTYDVTIVVWDEDDNVLAYETESPWAGGPGQYKWDSVQSTEFFYQAAFELDFDGPQELTVRFFASPVNDPIDSTFLSLIVPGGLGYVPGDTTGRKIKVWGTD